MPLRFGDAVGKATAEHEGRVARIAERKISAARAAILHLQRELAMQPSDLALRCSVTGCNRKPWEHADAHSCGPLTYLWHARLMQCGNASLCEAVRWILAEGK